MEIQKVKLEDVRGLVGLVQLMGYVVDNEMMRKRLDGIISNSEHCLLVAKEGGNVVGFCHAYVRHLVEIDTTVEIGGLAVVEAYQGKGIARKLIEEVEARAKDHKVSCIQLSSNVVREKAHGFYEHVGYSKLKQQFVFEKWL